MTSSGCSIFYFQAQLAKIIDFFKNLPQEELGVFFGPDLMKDYNQCLSASFNTIDECVECGKKLQTLFEKYEIEYERVNPPSWRRTEEQKESAIPLLFGIERSTFNSILGSFNAFFLIVAKEVYKGSLQTMQLAMTSFNLLGKLQKFSLIRLF